VSVRTGIATELVLNNGMVLEGNVGKVAGLAENPLIPGKPAGEVDVRLVVLVDNGLTRTFVSTYQVQQVRESQAGRLERILIPQRVAARGSRVGSVGPLVRVEPFDAWGRRTVSMLTARGRLDVVQGITEITPVWTKVEGLLGTPSVIWDMRIATSSIPYETLSQILARQHAADKPEGRLSTVRLLYESHRYKEARQELQQAIRDFPELAELRQLVRELRQRSSERLVNEIQLRRNAGQHRLALSMLNGFPAEEVAGETLEQVRELLAEYDTATGQGQRVHRLLEEHLLVLKDDSRRPQLARITDEIRSELNIHTLDRMADYLRLADDESLSAEQKLALAVSGWLLGSGAGLDNLSVALSLVQVRDLVRSYVQSSRKQERDAILADLATQEGSSPSQVARLLAQMKPPRETSLTPPNQESGPAATPGLLTLSVAGPAGQEDITYYVQLPPEYDPYRRYPAIVSLHAAGTQPPQQIDWWAGEYSDQVKMRLGQATRRGYLVIAPTWTRPNQRKYEHSAREHAAVLYALRDACRRFAIDTDRVFLSGHSMGGDAAWDIGAAHPDLWAGVIPIVAVAEYPEEQAPKYVAHYLENAGHVAWYFIAGELDGDKLGRNARDLDRCFKRPNYDVMVVEYIGRGHEHFQDEIQRLFQWMELHRRNFFPREFTSASMRPWDNFFWWVELDDFPARSMVLPTDWPLRGATRAIATSGSVLPGNSIRLRTGAATATIWLTPDLVDFQKRIEISLNGRPQNVEAVPRVETLLEDARTRGDRLHPFWARVELASGRAR